MATSNKNKTQDETRPPSFMTRQGEMLEGVKEQLSSQFGLRFQRIEDAVATIAENMAALTQQVQAQLIKDETQDNEEISERHLQQPLILDQLLQNPSISAATEDDSRDGAQAHEPVHQTLDTFQPQSSMAVTTDTTQNAWLLSKMATPTDLLPIRPLPMSTRDLP